MLRLFVQYFLRGLLYTVPISIAIYVVVQIFLLIGDTLHRIGFTIHPIVDPFVGLALLVLLIIVFGILGSSILFRPFFRITEELIEKTPFVSLIYTSIKDILKAFVGENKRFNKPVLVAMNADASIEKIGFITQTDLEKLGIQGGKVAVYLPHSYNFSGNLFVVSTDRVKPIDMSSSEAMKFIVSGGIIETPLK
ncbi:MAG: DUF502 domain-containing protein [Bacteroidia bacterium]